MLKKSLQYDQYQYPKLFAWVWKQLNNQPDTIAHHTAFILAHRILGLSPQSIHELVVKEYPNKTFAPSTVRQCCYRQKVLIEQIQNKLNKLKELPND